MQKPSVAIKNDNDGMPEVEKVKRCSGWRTGLKMKTVSKLKRFGFWN